MSESHHIAEINVEAGNHAMPQDLREIELALRAGKVAWDKYPYLEHRYGERGRRFTDSDSCWLVTLARAPKETVVTKSLEWLRTVLASRGLPTLILESHLLAIAADFGEQLQFAQFLGDREAERRSLFGTEGRFHLMDAFDQRLRACAGFKIEEATELIVSAWVDDRAGIDRAIPALCDWLTDPERFSPDWIAAVHDLLAELNSRR